MYAAEARNFIQWRQTARSLLTLGVPPAEVIWSDPRHSTVWAHAQGTLIPAHGQLETSFTVPRELLRLLREIACYRAPGRWGLMYRLVWRVIHENRRLLNNPADVDVHAAESMAKAVRRDVQQMQELVHFRETQSLDRPDDGSHRHVAWFEPEHEVLELVVPFFERRYPDLQWLIVTPDGAALWNGMRTQLIESPPRPLSPRPVQQDDLWRAYYTRICNTARVSAEALRREIPEKYWKYLPEAGEISALVNDSSTPRY